MCNHYHIGYCHCYCNQYCPCCGAYLLSGHYWWCHHYKPVIYMPCPYPPTQINIKIELPKPLAKRKSKADW